MDGAVPGKHRVPRHRTDAGVVNYDELPILVWGFNSVVPADGRRQTYVYASSAEDGQLMELPLEECSIDWRLVDGAWVPLYDDGTDEEEEAEPGDEPQTEA